MKAFMIYAESREMIEQLEPEEKAELLDALMAYSFGGDMPQISRMAKTVFISIRQKIDVQEETYRSKSKAGAASAEARRNKAEQAATEANTTEQAATETNTAGNININKNTNINPNGEEKEEPTAPRKSAPRFVPPTVEQVAAYVTEKGLRMDPERFVNFYASKGWKVGKDPMKDWQAAARGWAARDKARGEPEKQKTDYKSALQGIDYSELLRKGTG